MLHKLTFLQAVRDAARKVINMNQTRFRTNKLFFGKIYIAIKILKIQMVANVLILKLHSLRIYNFFFIILGYVSYFIYIIIS